MTLFLIFAPVNLFVFLFTHTLCLLLSHWRRVLQSKNPLDPQWILLLPIIAFSFLNFFFFLPLVLSPVELLDPSDNLVLHVFLFLVPRLEAWWSKIDESRGLPSNHQSHFDAASESPDYASIFPNSLPVTWISFSYHLLVRWWIRSSSLFQTDRLPSVFRSLHCGHCQNFCAHWELLFCFI